MVLMSWRSVKNHIFFYSYAYRMLKCLQKQTVLSRAKRQHVNFLFILLPCRTSVLNVISLFYFSPIPPCLFKNTPLVCLEKNHVIWTWLPPFLLPDCNIWGLPGAEGWSLERDMAQELDKHLQWEDSGGKGSWRTLHEGHFRNLFASLSPPRQTTAYSPTAWANSQYLFRQPWRQTSRAGGAYGQLAINLKQIL